MVPEPVRVHVHPALAAAAGDDLVDAGGGQRPAVVLAEPQLGPVRLGVPGAGPQVAVQAAGRLVADLDGPGRPAFAADPDLPALQVDFPTAHIDAVVSRSFGQGFELAQALRDQGLLGPVVVIHLGTNGAFSAAQLDQLMQVLAAVPKVIFLNVHVPGRAYQDTVNAMLAAQLPQYKNVAPLIDWNGITADKSSTDFFYKDGIHLRPPAQKFYADLIRQAVG